MTEKPTKIHPTIVANSKGTVSIPFNQLAPGARNVITVKNGLFEQFAVHTEADFDPNRYKNDATVIELSSSPDRFGFSWLDHRNAELSLTKIQERTDLPLDQKYGADDMNKICVIEGLTANAVNFMAHLVSKEAEIETIRFNLSGTRTALMNRITGTKGTVDPLAPAA